MFNDHLATQIGKMMYLVLSGCLTAHLQELLLLKCCFVCLFDFFLFVGWLVDQYLITNGEIYSGVTMVTQSI